MLYSFQTNQMGKNSNKNLRLRVLAVANDLHKLAQNQAVGSPPPAKPEATRAPITTPQARTQNFKWVRRNVTFRGLIAAVVIPLLGFAFKIERDRDVQIRDQQARLVAIGPLSLPSKSEHYVLRMLIKNEGKTTAYNVGGRIQYAIVQGAPGGSEPDFDPLTYRSQHTVDIAPQFTQGRSEVLFSYKLDDDPAEMAAYRTMIDRLNAGEFRLYFFGGERFTTEFGDTGILKYCYRYDPGIRNVITCGGERNRSYVIPKGWLATLVSAIPDMSK